MSLQVSPVAGERQTHILVVDDEELVRSVATEMLAMMGCQVTACVNGEDAERYYVSHFSDIDLVLLDMIMPKKNGRDTYLALKQINPAVRALLFTGYHINEEAKHILELGVLGIIRKPFDMRSFLCEVAGALRVSMHLDVNS